MSPLVRLDWIDDLAPWVDPSKDAPEIIPASLPSLPSTKDELLQGKTIWAVVLSIKHGSASKVKIFDRNNTGWQSSYNSKRQRVSTLASYDRLIICGCLADPSTCFAIVWNTSNEFKRAIRNLEGIVIGSVIYIGEPEKSNGLLGSTMPIIIPRWPLVPIKPRKSEDLFTEMLPATRFHIPDGAGEHRHFVFHNVAIAVIGYKLVLETVSCSGRFCDRSQPLVANVSCGCHTINTTRFPVVGECIVKIGLPTEAAKEAGEEEAVVRNFRSLRTTEVFFENHESIGALDNQVIEKRTMEFRKKIDTIVDYINQDGGWTIAGWFKKGESQDASTAEAKVDSTEVTLHLSLLVPSKKEIRTREDGDYKKLLIRATV